MLAAMESFPSTRPGDAPEATMRSIIERIAIGPELSKDLPREDAHAGLRLVLKGVVDPVQAAIFLIALRMKRETDDEYAGLLDALRDETESAVAAVDDLVDLGEPYGGGSRSVPMAAFVPPVLAACGVPTVIHGVHSMGPKHGVTPRQVLAAAGLPVDHQPGAAAARLADPAIGWAYIDQRAFSPALHGLMDLRERMIKRTALTTLERLLGPVRARGRTHLVIGYVHQAYPRIYRLLAQEAGFDSALVIRGIEGGIIPSLRGQARVHRLAADAREEAADGGPRDFAPADFGLKAALEPPRPAGPAATADEAAAAGRSALLGEAGPPRDALVSAAALVLWHLGREADLQAAATRAEEAISSGAALRRFTA